MTLRDSAAVLPSAPEAVTVIAHLPAVSSYGVLYDPSSATFAVTEGGARGGAGVALLPGTPVGPTYVALTTTVAALVAVPATGIAPFSNEAPSAGWSTVSVGASISRSGTVMKTLTIPSERLPVSGSSDVTWNWLRPRRRSTAAAHVP